MPAATPKGEELSQDFVSPPDAARILEVPYKMVLRTIERDLFTGTVRVGRMRLIAVGRLGELRKAMEDAGYVEPKGD